MCKHWNALTPNCRQNHRHCVWIFRSVKNNVRQRVAANYINEDIRGGCAWWKDGGLTSSRAQDLTSVNGFMQKRH